MLEAACVVPDGAAGVQAKPHLMQLLLEDLCLPCYQILHGHARMISIEPSSLTDHGWSNLLQE